jgi:glycosyltransferase involved in cell wall biosynthesis
MRRASRARSFQRPTLRIGIDAHAIGERKTGNERFASGVIPALRAACEHELVLYFTDPAAAKAWSGLERTRTRVLRPRHPLLRIPFVLPAVAAWDGLDVLLVQYTGPPLLGRPLVTVVHDVAFDLFPGFFSPIERIWMRRTIPFTMRRAAGVVTVSNFSRNEIVRRFGIDPSRITVAPNGVDPSFADPTPRPRPVDAPYFLAVGNLQPRKNLFTLIRAYARAVERRPDLPERLVIVGQDLFAARSIYDEAEPLRREGRIRFTGYVSDQELIGLLQGATAFAYPSVYEGFGLPPLEAMAAGVPSVVGDIPVMREVAGEAALLVPVTSVEGWADALLRVGADPALRSDLAARGRERASTFTWQRSAALVLQALEAAARGSRSGA